MKCSGFELNYIGGLDDKKIGAADVSQRQSFRQLRCIRVSQQSASSRRFFAREPTCRALAELCHSKKKWVGPQFSGLYLRCRAAGN